MRIALNGGPAEAAAHLIAHLKRIGVLDESGNVAEPSVAISARSVTPTQKQPTPSSAERGAVMKSGNPADTDADAMQEYYIETALLRRLCRSMKAPIRPCRSFEEFDARFDRPGDNWERLANFENDAIVALARAGRGQ